MKKNKNDQDLLRLNELLKKLKEKGKFITKRTFEFYQKLGFLPKPIKTVGEGGRGVYGLYNLIIVEFALEIIEAEKGKGLTLKQIYEQLSNTLLKKYKNYLEKWGYLKLTECIYDDDCAKLFSEDKDIITEPFHRVDLDGAELWWPDILIEELALKKIKETASSVIMGVTVAHKLISKNKHVNTILKQLECKALEAHIVKLRADLRLGEISSSQYDKATLLRLIEKSEKLLKKIEKEAR